MNNSKEMRTLVKFSTYDNVVKLRNGSLYMNTVEYFANCENSTQSDSFEGTDFLHQAGKINSIIVDNNRGKIITLSKESGLVNFMGGSLKTHYTNIFCMYLWKILIGETNSVDKRITKFGDTALLITNPHEFIKRVIRAVQRENYSCKADCVKYFDEDTHHGDVGLFMKREMFDYMSEYRIAVEANMDNKPLKLFIGDISDISVICKSQDMALPQWHLKF